MGTFKKTEFIQPGWTLVCLFVFYWLHDLVETLFTP